MNQYPWEFSPTATPEQHNEHIRHMKFIIQKPTEIFTLKNQPIRVRVFVGLSNLSFLTCWNFSANFILKLFVACRHKAQPSNYSATIDWFVENWEACSHPSALRLTHCLVSYTWLVSSLDHKNEGKGSHQQPFVGGGGGALRDDTKNGCVADYRRRTNLYIWLKPVRSYSLKCAGIA